MIKSIKDKLWLFILTLSTITANAQFDGPGGFEPANPIDMYVYVLMAIGVLFIAFFGKRLMKSKA